MLERIKKERLTVKQVQDIIKENKEQVEEMDINPNMQTVLSGLDIVNKKSNTFDDVEPEIVEDKMDKTQMINIDAIKASAQDITSPLNKFVHILTHLLVFCQIYIELYLFISLSLSNLTKS